MSTECLSAGHQCRSTPSWGALCIHTFMFNIEWLVRLGSAWSFIQQQWGFGGISRERRNFSCHASRGIYIFLTPTP